MLFQPSQFRVLLLDDSTDVCERVKHRIEGPRASGQVDPIVPVEVCTVTIGVERSPEGKSTFSASTFDELTKSCSRRPDLVLLDYGYAEPEIIAALRKEAESREITAEELHGKVLTPLDLANWIRTSDTIPSSSRHLLINHLLEAGQPVYLYSYTSKEFLRALGEMSERTRKTALAFANKSVVIPVDTREELYHSTEFDWPTAPSKHDKQFYAYQVSVLLDHIVHKEILRARLAAAKYLRIRRTILAAGVLTAVGAAVGFGAQWVGSLIADLSKTGHSVQAVFVGLSAAIVLFFLGLGVPLIFERFMINLIDRDE